MAQQTAVEWLIEQLVELDKQLDGRRKSNNSTVIKLNPTKIYEQARQMEKEQMLWFFKKFHMITEESNNHYIKEFEQYYNETYEK